MFLEREANIMEDNRKQCKIISLMFLLVMNKMEADHGVAFGLQFTYYTWVVLDLGSWLQFFRKLNEVINLTRNQGFMATSDQSVYLSISFAK